MTGVAPRAERDGPGMSQRGQILAQRARTLREPLRFPALRRLWVAQVVSDMGDWAARLALSVLVYERTGSATATGLTLAVSLAPWLGPGQLLTSWSERWPRRRVMVASDIVRAVMFTLAVFPVPVPVLLALVFAAGLATPPFEAARSALRPEISPPHVLGPAIALSGISEELAVIAGYVAGGAVITLAGAPIALLVNSGTFAVSAFIALGLPRGAPVASAGRRRVLRRAAGVIRSDAPIRRAAVLVAVATFAGTGVVAISAPLVLTDLGGSPAVLTGLLVLTSVTAMAVTGTVRLNAGAARLLRLCATLLAGGGSALFLGLTAVGVLAGAELASALLAFAGLGLLFVVISPANTLVSPRLPTDVRASALALLMGTMCAAEALGAALAGVVASRLGATPAGALVALIPLAAGAYALVRWGKGRYGDGEGDGRVDVEAETVDVTTRDLTRLHAGVDGP